MDLGNIERIALQLSSNILGLAFLILAALVALLFAGWVIYMLWSGLKSLFRRKDGGLDPEAARAIGNFKASPALGGLMSGTRGSGLTPDDAKALENFKALAGSGIMGETIKAAYATSEAQERRMLREEVGRIVSGEKKGRCALDPP